MTRAAPRACVIGWPVRHSRSPLIHRYWLRQLGLAGEYVHAEVAPEDFAAFAGALAQNGFVGANVTIPHKEAALAICDVATPAAKTLGAANTLWLHGGKLHGDNTDVAGFLDNLDEGSPGWDRRVATAVVVGAGGAARAVVYALGARGVSRCILVNRTLARAQALSDRFVGTAPQVVARAWGELPRCLAAADLIVNTTSLGMAGQPPLEVDLGQAPEHALVTDIVYVPLVTPLLAAARARRLAVIDGLGMLLHQAAPGFAHWFGVAPRVTPALRAVVVADLERTAIEPGGTAAGHGSP